MTAKVPRAEREFVANELLWLCGRLAKNCRLTAAESKQAIKEILSSDVYRTWVQV